MTLSSKIPPSTKEFTMKANRFILAAGLLLFIALAAYGQGQTSVAVLPSDGDAEVFNNDDLEALTNKMRSVALETLPSEKFALLTQEVVIKRLGGEENFIKECRETACIVDLGKKAQRNEECF